MAGAEIPDGFGFVSSRVTRQEMSIEKFDTLVIGGGQAGLAMSEHLGTHNIPHLILERDRIAERWRTARWDSLVANGPAWHDRFPSKKISNLDPDAFASKDEMVKYFEEFANQINAPIRCGVEVLQVNQKSDGSCFVIETSQGGMEALNVVVATGPFQTPVIPPVIPEIDGIQQLHSNEYQNPTQLPDGNILVVGAGSSGAQIADELLTSGRQVFLSVGPHDRPPRSYRGHDFVWWLGVLGKWEAKTPEKGREHVTISVSGANGGHTVDFRRLAARGMNLVGMTEMYRDGVLSFAPDLGHNIENGDSNYLSVLDEADAYISKEGLDFPEEPEARNIDPIPACVSEPILNLDLNDAGITSIIWATGYKQEFDWLKIGVFDQTGKPKHHRGVTDTPGLYFLGLPWLSMRGSSFIWGVWKDAQYLAEQVSNRPRN